MEPQLLIVLCILAVTVFLIVTELLRIDLVAILAMLSLVWCGSITPTQARSGFSSNAVVAIIAVMILGRGLYKAAVTEKIAQFILKVAGRGRRRVITTISATVGVMSGFMQNIGAAALFLPVMTGISKRQQLSISNLLMPMGFAALLGGTTTMVGTSSLIILNDLLGTRGIETFGLFTVTPIGITLLLAGIGYFFVFGHLVLPRDSQDQKQDSKGQKLLDVWGLSDSIFTYRIAENSPLVGRNVEESAMGSEHNINLLRIYDEDESEYNIWEEHHFQSGQLIVVQGQPAQVREFARNNNLALVEEETKSVSDDKRGYLEVVVPARSNLVGNSIREVALRDTYNAQVVLFFSESQIIEEGTADRKVKPGDTLILYGKWDNLRFFEESEDFITVTPLPKEKKNPEKAGFAVMSFIAAVVIVMAMDLSISLGFLTGAVAMILGGVLTIEDAYRAVEWKVIFLISGLIPIGIAMQESGAASFIAQSLVSGIAGAHPFIILFVLGVLTTLFSLFMSNVAATVLMVPLVLEMAPSIAGLGSRMLVLQVGICAANSFILPTHHVNALLMTPGGYRVSDYLKAGGGLSLIFVSISSSMLYLFYG